MNKTACGIKYQSKRGVTLVELVVGIAIIVMVFGATLGALTNGYATTIKNAEKDKAAAVCASVNDTVTATVKNLNIEDYDAGMGETVKKLTDQSEQNQKVIERAAQKAYAQVKFDSSVASQMKYVKTAGYPNNTDDAQFTYDFGTATSVTKGANTSTVRGATIKTAVAFSDGYVYNESFISFKKVG